MADKFTKHKVSQIRLKETVAQLPASFRTTDVSKHRDVQNAYKNYSDDPQFHQIFGIALSAHKASLRIKKIDDSPNATWQKIED